MLTSSVNDPRAWTAATIGDRAHWYCPLPAKCLDAFEQVRRQGPLPMLPNALRQACAESLAPVRSTLEEGRGFAIIESPQRSDADATLLYWIVGQSLGRPFAQNVQGAMLYDVRDVGGDLTQGARFSVTNYESSFHTDNSFGEEVLDYVGLLCLKVAKSGGRSQVLSAYSVHNELANRPEVLNTLYRPFHVEHRGGAGRTVRVPVFESTGRELIVRYLRYWIEAGHGKVGEPLTSEQKAALDALDDCLNRRDLRVEFDLKPGDMYFINNRWTLHNRTAFEDYAEMERRRHLVRLWLQK